MTRFAWLLGCVTQSLVMGYLLFFAILQMYASGTGASVFQYQGY